MSANYEELLDRLQDFQALLGVSDWDIRLELVHRWELVKWYSMAGMEYDCNGRTGVMKVCPYVEEYPDLASYNGIWGVENWMLHELIHLHLDRDAFSVEEQAVNALTRGFWTLYRELR